MRHTRSLPLLGIGILLAGTVSVSLLTIQPKASAAKGEASRKTESIRWTKSESKAIAAYRAEGQAGLDRLMTEKAPILNRPLRAGGDKEKSRLHEMLDAVAQQKDSVYAGLYWYTDLEAAKKAAVEKKLPILSLRLLGKLTDERSCANSRFFRSVLYPNAHVADFLKSNFILHWSSERPVPLVTIDYGDGRRIETTLTGNSIHYVLDANGTPIDALPGLYSPHNFLVRLNRISNFMAQNCRPSDAPELTRQTVARYHQMALLQLNREWEREASHAEKLLGINAKAIPARVETDPALPEAVRAQRRTESKVGGEMPLLARLLPEHLAPEAVVKTDKIWGALAELRLKSEDPLDIRSLELMRQKLAGLPEAEFQKILTMFRKQIVIDSARNEYAMHRQLHLWFATNSAADFHSLNTRVYADLFLTPASDPWLGLIMEGQYTGLPNGGISQPVPSRQNVATR